jgi:hypothetical protein
MGIQRPERYYIPLTVSNCNAIREIFVVSCQNTANYSQRSITWYRQQALICFLRLTDLSVPRNLLGNSSRAGVKFAAPS